MPSSVRSHKNFYDNRSQEEIEAGAKDVAVRVLRLGSFSVDLRATVWAKSAGQAYDMCCDLNLSIKKEVLMKRELKFLIRIKM